MNNEVVLSSKNRHTMGAKNSSEAMYSVLVAIATTTGREGAFTHQARPLLWHCWASNMTTFLMLLFRYDDLRNAWGAHGFQCCFSILAKREDR